MVQNKWSRSRKSIKSIFYLVKAKYIEAKMEKSRREMVCGL
jgi:hypothetical protein